MKMTASRLFLPALCALVLSSLNLMAAEELVPLKPDLPQAAFVGTPKDTPSGAKIDSGKLDKPLMIPKDAVNIAPKATLTTSDTHATAHNLVKIVDGDKEARDSSVVLLRKGPQYLQFDFGSPKELFAIVIWHAHDTPKVYHDVVVQVADDADFTKNVRTLFNNDKENTVGRGAGTDREYFETFEGKTIDAKGEKAQFVRLYSKGSTDSSLNEYTEVEIYGRPPK
jgi:hypothetical protein